MARPSNSSLTQAAWSYLSAHPLDVLLLAFGAAIALRYGHADALWVFVASAVAIVPLAGLMGRATETLAARLGPGIGGLLNATFGNAAEMIIALVALAKGPHMYPLVKASITGSIICNVLLVLGLSFTLGGVRFRYQHFNSAAASMGATLLTLATVGLMMPTLYYHVFAAGSPVQAETMATIESLSEEIAAVLAFVYLLSLVFTLGTHRSMFDGSEQAAGDASADPKNSNAAVAGAVAVLIVATVGVAIMSELLVETVELATHALGMSSVFVGVIVVAIVGNAAEHSTAVTVALKNQMDLSVNIAVGSGIQIALFVAPVLVFCSLAMGHDRPLDLHFTLMEIVAVAISIFVLALVAHDGQSHWLEGVMLLAVYAVLALAFYHLGEISPPDLHPA
jgi:Ca2+:H+ antiporter